MKNKFKDEYMVYFDNAMFLPIQYHNNIVTEPSFDGIGNHSVKKLEEICIQYQEYCHQQLIIKNNVIKHLLDSKYNLNLVDEDIQKAIEKNDLICKIKNL